MGRLLKKKTELEKRKKKDDRLTDHVAQQDEYQAKALQAKEEKKKQYIESQKTGTTIKSELIAEREDTFFEKTSKFFQEVKIELEKVVWPSRKQTMLSTAVALVLVVIISVFLGVADSLLAWIIKLAY